MTYEELLASARTCMGAYCKACPVCNGKACGSQIPGPGAKGSGDTAIRNYQKWQEIRVNMDTLSENQPVSTALELFGQTFRYPFFAGPVGAVNLHYGDKYTDVSYNEILVSAATQAIKAAGGMGVPTVKPWNLETIREKFSQVHSCGAFAAAMDVDAAGLPFLKNMTPPAGRKSVEELAEIIKESGLPFIVKGIMTVKGALKAKEAGASAIVVSNHGGRVLDQCPATAEVLEEITEAVDGSMKILVDSGLRSGADIFKALALGADGVIICRPFVTAVYGGGAEGVHTYIEKIGAELQDTMAMCGANSLEEITRDMVRCL